MAVERPAKYRVEIQQQQQGSLATINQQPHFHSGRSSTISICDKSLSKRATARALSDPRYYHRTSTEQNFHSTAEQQSPPHSDGHEDMAAKRILLQDDEFKTGNGDGDGDGDGDNSFWDSLQPPDADLESKLLRLLSPKIHLSPPASRHMPQESLLAFATNQVTTEASVRETSAPETATSETLAHQPLMPEPPSSQRIIAPPESLERKEYLTDVFRKMMFVSGETAEASAETTWLIEEIVREQVVHMLKVATEYANRRGHKSITVADLIFQIRHDKSKVSRLKTFLSWKDVRKNVKDSDDKGGGDAGDIDLEADGAQAPAAGGPAQKANKKQKLVLPWDVESYYAVQVPERDDEEDEEEDEQNEATLARLASADERTRNMTREEYVYWSDCRQASFTFRKGKRFREWAGFGTVVDAKPNDDVVDILGFLTFEIVQTLTETALRVKGEKDLANRKNANGQGEKKRKREECSLFSMTEEGRTPVEPEHVREAFRRLQIPPKKATFFQQGWTGMRRPYRLI